MKKRKWICCFSLGAISACLFSLGGRSTQLNFCAILPVPGRVDWEIFTCFLSWVRPFLHKCLYRYICVYISILYINIYDVCEYIHYLHTAVHRAVHKQGNGKGLLCQITTEMKICMFKTQRIYCRPYWLTCLNKEDL